MVEYYHRCCFSPVISTWITATNKGTFCTWPGLTAKLVQKHMGKSMATEKVHMQQQMKNLRSTKPKLNKTIDTKTEEFYFAVTPLSETGKTFSDQIGRFLVTSSRGNKYIMIMYDYDSNSINGEAMKSRTREEILRAFTKLHQKLKNSGLTPNIHRIDNERSTTLNVYMKAGNIAYQLVPP